MRHLHPNLGAAVTGRRKKIYVATLLMALPGSGLVWLGIILGLIPPTPTDEYISWAMLVWLFIPFVAYWDNPGEKRTSLEKMAEFGFSWLLVSGIAQTFWELPWFILDFTGIVHNITESDVWLWSWWVYGAADTRYITSNPTIAGLEFMAGLAGPVELWAFWKAATAGNNIKQRLTACWWALVIGIGLTWATGVFFVAEWHVDWVNIQQGWFGFWVKFVGLNVPWFIAPIICIPAALWELAYLYRLQGYEAAQAQLAGKPVALPDGILGQTAAA